MKKFLDIGKSYLDYVYDSIKDIGKKFLSIENENESNQSNSIFNKNIFSFELNDNNQNNNNTSNNDNSNQNNKLENFKMTHLRGLVNIANTCYMNSVLQSFSHIKELVVYFQKDKIAQMANNSYNYNKFFPSFREVILNLWKLSDNSSYSPENFKNKLGEMNPLFKGAYPNDAKDLLTFILLKLHEELNKPKNNNINNNFNNNININMQDNKYLMFNCFKNYFMDNYRSIISDLFYGIIYTKSQCNFCGVTLYNYQTFNFIIFPLQKVLQHKMNSTNFISNFNNTVTIEDCFEDYQSITLLNDYYCNKCKNTITCQYSTYFSVFPNIIIIILNRGHGLQYNVKISFDENIGLKKYAEYSNDELKYELIGLVTHYGESSINGHFMARCKSPIDGMWYLYNDQIINKIGYFNKEEFMKGNPYILFYKKINFLK